MDNVVAVDIVVVVDIVVAMDIVMVAVDTTVGYRSTVQRGVVIIVVQLFKMKKSQKKKLDLSNSRRTF